MNFLRSAQAPPTEGLNGFWRPVFVFIVSLFFAARLFWQVSHYAVNISFYSDQWDFNDCRHGFFQSGALTLGDVQLAAWSAPPRPRRALFPKLLEPHFRWNSRIEAFLATAIVVTAAVCALYLKKRLWGPLSHSSDIAIPLMFFTPAQYENLWITPNFAHGPFPLLLVVVYCLALTCQHRVTRYSPRTGDKFHGHLIRDLHCSSALSLPCGCFLDYYLQRRAAQRPEFGSNGPGTLLVIAGLIFCGLRLLTGCGLLFVAPSIAYGLFRFLDLMLAHFFGARGSRFYVSIPMGCVILAVMILVWVIFGKHLKQSEKVHR